MRKLYSAAEIVELGIKSLPGTRENMQRRAEREGWYSEERIGKGGPHKVYEIPARYLEEKAATEAGPGGAVPSPKPAKVVSINADREQRMLDIGMAVDQWLLETKLVMHLDKKYMMIQLLYRYFEMEKEFDSAKLAEMIRKLA